MKSSDSNLKCSENDLLIMKLTFDHRKCFFRKGEKNEKIIFLKSSLFIIQEIKFNQEKKLLKFDKKFSHCKWVEIDYLKHTNFY